MHYIPPRKSTAIAQEGAKQVMFGALENISKKTGLKPKDIGILVVNCSIFNPTLSLSTMIVNMYKVQVIVRASV